MIRLAAAIFLTLHGVAHLVGFMGAWGLGEFADAPRTTTILGGVVDLGETGIRVFGVLWVVAATALGVVAVRLWRRGSSAVVQPLGGVAAFSLALCIAALPEAALGSLIDIGILVGVGVMLVGRPDARLQAHRR